MKIRYEPEDEREARLSQWRLAFAWVPTRVAVDDMRWLERIEVREIVTKNKSGVPFLFPTVQRKAWGAKDETAWPRLAREVLPKPPESASTKEKCVGCYGPVHPKACAWCESLWGK
jgi:hypothetical protein